MYRCLCYPLYGRRRVRLVIIRETYDWFWRMLRAHVRILLGVDRGLHVLVYSLNERLPGGNWHLICCWFVLRTPSLFWVPNPQVLVIVEGRPDTRPRVGDPGRAGQRALALGRMT